MRNQLELPRLSHQERDRRWSAVRRMMKEKNLDCLILCGWPVMWDFGVANARYLCPIGGNAAHNMLIFPLNDEPTCFVFSPVMLEYWRGVQDWVSDLRGRTGPWADVLAGRIQEMGLDKGNIGIDGLAGPLDPDGWVPHSMFVRMQELLPQASLVNIDDMLEKMRAIKSAEEIDFIQKAAGLGDLMMQACKETARPGVKECEVYARMVEVMIANGGEEPTLFLWAADSHPFPHPFRLPTTRRLAPDDIIIIEIHPKYGGYFTHVERTFCLGEPDPNYRRIYDGCIAAYQRGFELFEPGAKISTALEAVRETIEERGLGMCETGIHGHGLGSLEYPRYRHHALSADQEALKKIGDEFLPGMVFAFNIDLFDPNWRDGETGCVFAETIVITETGARALHAFSTEFQVLAG